MYEAGDARMYDIYVWMIMLYNIIQTNLLLRLIIGGLSSRGRVLARTIM